MDFNMDIAILIDEYKKLRAESELSKEDFDEAFSSQFEGEFLSMNDAEYAEFWDVVNNL